MDLQTIEMPPSEAAAKLEAAERQIKRYRNPQPRLEALRDGYKALEKGQKLIELGPTIGRGGWDEEGRPRLAVARSDRSRVGFRFSNQWRSSDHRQTVQFTTQSIDTERLVWGGGRGGPSMIRSVSVRHFPDHPTADGWAQAVAIVPIVPPDVLEAAGNPALKKCFTLFEADWEDVPVDPALLRHLGGDLYAVLATWNLTDLEQAVLREFSVEA